MNRKDMALSKELAVMHLRVARAELALARSRRPDPLAAAVPVLTAVSSALDTPRFGKWSHYARWALRLARLVIDVRRLV